jgi:MFS family permease
MSSPPRAGRLADLRQRVWADPKYPGWLLVTCLVGMFSTSFPATILTISVRTIASDLDSLPTTIVWVTTAPILAAAATTPILGRLGDIKGHRRLYLTGFMVAITFSLLTAVAWNAASLIAFRTISQLGSAATVPASLAMIFRIFPPEQRVRASALSSSVLAGAAVAGTIIGGPLVDAFGWRPIFVIQAGIALAALLPALVVLQPDEAHDDDAPLDIVGAGLLFATVFCVTFGINRLAVWGPTPLVLAVLALSPLAMWLLVRVERRAVAPILPLHILKRRDVRLIAGSTFAVGASWMGNFVITPLLLQSVMGFSAGATSAISIPRAGAVTLASPHAGKMGMRHGERPVIRVASIGLAATLVLLAVGAATTTTAVIVVALAASGFAFAHVQPPLLSLISNAVDEEDLGLATSIQQTASQVGSVIGLGLVTAVAADAIEPRPFVLVYLGSALLPLVAFFLIGRLHGPDDTVITGVIVGDDLELTEPMPITPEQVVHRETL